MFVLQALLRQGATWKQMPVLPRPIYMNPAETNITTASTLQEGAVTWVLNVDICM